LAGRAGRSTSFSLSGSISPGFPALPFPSG